jgi:hypothetical protein
MPVGRTDADRPTANSFVRHDVITCALDDRAEELKRRIDASPYGFALVVAERVVLGRIRRSRRDDGSMDKSAEFLMESGH